jgi:hypothetical protein
MKDFTDPGETSSPPKSYPALLNMSFWLSYIRIWIQSVPTTLIKSILYIFHSFSYIKQSQEKQIRVKCPENSDLSCDVPSGRYIFQLR